MHALSILDSWRKAVLLLVVLIFHISCSYATALVSIEPATTNRDLGDTFSLDVLISGGSDVYAFQFDLIFSPIVLAAEGVSEGGFLSAGGPTIFIPGEIDNALGTISFAADSLLGAVPGADGDGILASITFRALGVGSSMIDVANLILLDSSLADIYFSTAGGLADIQNGSSVPVPVPATISLLCVALVGLSCIGRSHIAAA